MTTWSMQQFKDWVLSLQRTLLSLEKHFGSLLSVSCFLSEFTGLWTCTQAGKNSRYSIKCPKLAFRKCKFDNRIKV